MLKNHYIPSQSTPSTMKFRILLLLAITPLFLPAQIGNFSFETELPADMAQMCESRLREGLKTGKYLAHQDFHFENTLTYNDVFWNKEKNEEWGKGLVKRFKVSVEWVMSTDYVGITGIAPVYEENIPVAYYKMWHLVKVYPEEAFPKLIETLNQRLIAHVNEVPGDTNLVRNPMITRMNSVDMKEGSLFTASFQDMADRLFKGLATGKYLAYNHLDKALSLTFDDVLKLLDLEDWKYWDPVDFKRVAFCEKWVPAESRQTYLSKKAGGFVRQLFLIGLVGNNGKIFYLNWEDVSETLNTNLYMREYSAPVDKVPASDQATGTAIYRLYVRNMFAEKMGVEIYHR